MDRRLIDALMEAVVPVIREREAVLIARIEALEARPAPERGEKGDKGDAGDKGDPGIPGERGTDAAPVTKEQILDAARETIEHAAMEWVAANPAKDGKDGETGQKGEQGDKGDRGDRGEPGRDGRDGLPGAQGGKGADGLNGKDGRDGLSFEDFDAELAEDGRTLVLKLARGETVIKRDVVLPHPLDRGVWKELTDYVRGDGVTHDGSFWIAQRETQTRPGMPGSDWRLAVKKGQNGKDLRDEQRIAAPVRFK